MVLDPGKQLEFEPPKFRGYPITKAEYNLWESVRERSDPSPRCNEITQQDS